MKKTITTLLLLAICSLGFVGCSAYDSVKLSDQEREDMDKENSAFLQDNGLAAEADEEIVYTRELMEKYHDALGEQYDYIRNNRVRLLETDE